MSYNCSSPPTRHPTRRSYTRDRSSDYISRSSRPDAQYDYISGTSRTSGTRHAARSRRSYRHNERDEDQDEDDDGDYIAPPRRRSPSRADYIDPRPHRPSRKSHGRVDSGYSRYAEEQRPAYPTPHYSSVEPEERYVRYADEQHVDKRDRAAYGYPARRTRNVRGRHDSDVEDKPRRHTRDRSSSYTSPPPHRYSQPAHSNHDSIGESDSASDSDVVPVRSSTHRHRRRRSPSPHPALRPVDSDIGSDSDASVSDIDYGDGIVPANHDPLAFNTRRTRRYRASDISLCEHDVLIRGRDTGDLEELRSPSEHARERGNGRVKRRAKRSGDEGDAGEMRRRYEAYVEDGSDASDVEKVDGTATSASESEDEDEDEGHNDNGHPASIVAPTSSHPSARQPRRLGDDLVLRPRSPPPPPPPAGNAADPDTGSDSDVVAFRGRDGVGKIGAWISDEEDNDDADKGGAWTGGSDIGTVPVPVAVAGSRRVDAGRRAKRGGESVGRRERRGGRSGGRGGGGGSGDARHEWWG